MLVLNFNQLTYYKTHCQNVQGADILNMKITLLLTLMNLTVWNKETLW